jgi:hypothetical protein
MDWRWRLSILDRIAIIHSRVLAGDVILMVRHDVTVSTQIYRILYERVIVPCSFRDLQQQLAF